MTSGQSRRCSACTGPFRLAPQELLDHIISYLADDKATLLSCALVHPTWTSISRYHLPPLNLVVASPSRATDLTELIHPPHETLSSCITGITLVGDLPFLNDLCITSGKFPRARFYGKLLRFLRAKPTVTLREGTVENDPALVRTLADNFPDLTSLNVRCASHQDIASFMCALSSTGSGSFPRLVELGVELGAYGLDSPHTVLALRDVRLGLPGLRRLRVVGWNDELVRWLGDNIVGTLESLDLDSVNVWLRCRVEEATLLIRGNKGTLRDLRLSFSEQDVMFDLSGLVCLENLEVMSVMDDLGWRLPRSLKRVYLRIVVRYFRCDIIRVETEGELLLEGEELERQLMIWQ